MADARPAASYETVLPRIYAGAWRLAAGATVLFLCSVGVFPFYWMFVTSIRPSTEIFEFPPRILPSGDSVFAPYLTLFQETGLAVRIWNSTAVSIANRARRLPVRRDGRLRPVAVPVPGSRRVSGRAAGDPDVPGDPPRPSDVRLLPAFRPSEQPIRAVPRLSGVPDPRRGRPPEGVLRRHPGRASRRPR